MLVGVVSASYVVLAYEVWRGLLLLVRVIPVRVDSVAHASVASAGSG